MNKRLWSFLLCLLLLIGMAVPAYAEQEEETEEVIEQVQEEVVIRTMKISTVEEFLDFAENCRLDSFSRHLDVSLEADIDLSGQNFTGVPIFCGTFRGKGHTISGLSITADGSNQGLFRYLTADAAVNSLTVEGKIQPAGSSNTVGAIAGSNAGTIDLCKFVGTVYGADYIGGIAGINTVTGIITRCSAKGIVQGDHFVGGITGENAGVVRGSTNWTKINVTPKDNAVEIADITLDTLTNSEAANTVTDIGGIAGLSSGVIRSCKNRGNVGYQLMGYNIGGITGTQSGYIVDSDNYGDIRGRKETGGIVGQMEPISYIDFSMDTLQILKQQLNDMSGMVSGASANAQSNAGQIAGQIGVLQDQVLTARDAVNMLIPNGETPSLPDADTILAARNTLAATMDSMPGTMREIASAAQATVSGLTRDLNAISGQINAMGQTINEASENLGGTVTDISDLDTPELLSGKLENCRNLGSVLADMNVGGIAGAMAMENDLDIWEDWEQYGEESLNFQSEVRAVILNCENTGVVTGKKQNVGGLVGWQSLGLVKDSINTGKVDAPGGNHVGGISGTSTGFIRSNYAKCQIIGDTYVGGIAGSAAIVSDCISQVNLVDGRERLGAILGWQEEPLTEEENPIYDNHYLVVEEDYGAIDGISYEGLGVPVKLNALLRLEDLPELFKTVTVHFVFEDGSVTDVSVPVGGDLKPTQIPELPVKKGYSARWDGLADAKLTDMLFDMRFEAVYTGFAATVASEETWKDGRPILLLEGSFTEEVTVSASASNALPELTDKETSVDAWQIQSSEPGSKARVLLTEAVDADALKLYVCGTDGQWRQTQFHMDGSYLVFSMEQQEANIAIVQTDEDYAPWLLGGAAVLVVIVLVMIVSVRRKRRMKAS